MKIHVKKKILFLGLLGGFLFLINFWMDRESSPHYPLQYDEAFHPTVNAKVIILGASHTAHGINPKYLEGDHLKMYNFSMDGASPSFNLAWYRKILRVHYPKPSVVIYGVHWGMFDGNLLQRRLEQDSRYFPFGFLCEELRELVRFGDMEMFKTLLLNRIGLVRGRRQLAQRLFRGTANVYPLSRYYHGFIPYERKGRLDKKRDVKPRNDPGEIKAFETLLDAFQQDRIQVIFVQVPGFLPAREGSNILESMGIINRIAEERQIPFLDYDTRRLTGINTDPGLFSDWVHLNEKGSDVFSRLLRTDLASILKTDT